MAEYVEKRAYERYDYKAPIKYKHYDKNDYYAAKTYNYSMGGMYFECDYDIQPGADIYIKMNNYSADTPGKVTWCKEYSALDSSYYGVGVKYYENK
jgi:Tfp pilus assembly protein PilZ